ncbi:MAG: hypothetical protein R3351_09515, partial [Nitrospirales bacterium]|nr:hypothetical protein [Nitrospirales bacterium]
NQSRCFTWVGDVVHALIQLAMTSEAVGEIFNIGSPNEISIRDLAFLVKEITGSSSEVAFIPYEQAYEQGFEDMNRRVPALEKINGLIGYTSTMDVRGIIEKVVEDFKARGLNVE